MLSQSWTALRRWAGCVAFLSVSVGLFGAPPAWHDNLTKEQRAYLESRIFVVSTKGTRSALPVRVVNTRYLPAVTSQGQLGVCGAYGITYYCKTYQEARERDWVHPDPAVDPAHCASTAYTYKLLRHGPQAGANPLVVAQNMVDFGVCSWADMPYSDSITTTTWPEAAYWRKAASWRARAAGLIPRLHLSEGRRALKAHLASGDLAAISVIAAPALFAYPEGQHTSNGVIYELDEQSTSISHALTIIGYDDEREYLDDRTGRLERGAFLCVNSWGTDWGIVEPSVGTRGFCWVAYDLFDGADASSYAIVMLDRIDYTPELMLRLGVFHTESKLFGTLTTSGRGDQVIDLFPGLGMKEKKLTDQEIWVDVSDLIAYGRAGFVLEVRDFSDVSGTLTSLAVQRWDENHALESLSVPAETEDFMSTMSGTRLYVGRYQERVSLPDLPLRTGDASWGDADNDGDLDLLVTGWFGGEVNGWRTYYFENLGGGELFQRECALSAGTTIHWMDVDNDGDLDVVIGADDGTRIYLSDGTGQFVCSGQALPRAEPGCLVLADMDRDGMVDLCLGNSEGAWVYRNDAGVFTRIDVGLPPLRTPSPGVRGGHIVAADVSGDGWVDVIMAGIAPDGAARVYRHQGLPLRFEPGAELVSRTSTPAVAVGDYDGDGALDVAISGCRDGAQMRVFRNRGDGRFELQDELLLPDLHDGNLCWTDVNADGRPDLVATGREKDVYGGYDDRYYTNETVVLTQSAEGAFELFGPPLPDVSRGFLSVADIDGDGNADIVLGGSLAQIFEQAGEKLTAAAFLHGAAFPGWYPGNSLPSAPTALHAAPDGHGNVAFHWEDAVDAETPAAALRYRLRCGTTMHGNDVLSAAMAVDAAGLYQRSGYTLRHVPSGTLYWQVQAVDGSGACSAWSAVQTLEVAPYVTRHYLELSVENDYAGSTLPTPGVSVHVQGSVVALTAMPASGYAFVGWEGDADGVGQTASSTVSMDGDRRLRACFAPISDPEHPAWTRHTEAMTGGHAVIGHTLESFGGFLLRLGGRVGWTARNLVYVSSDGATWQQLWQLAFEQGHHDWDDVPWPARYGHSSAVFDGRLWVLGGDSGATQLADVWCTHDLFTWTQVSDAAPWGGRTNAGCTVLDEKLWIVGGEDSGGFRGDVWSSSDGVAWTQVTAAAPWPAGPVQAAAFDNALVVHARGQIWRSEDGAAWERVLASGPFGERSECSLEVFQGNLVLSGGRDWSSWEVLDDVWVSSDGATWTRTAPAAAAHWSARRRHGTCLHAGRLWLVGGRGSDDSAVDDVWSLGSSALPAHMGRLQLSAYPLSGGRIEPPGNTSYVDDLGAVFSLLAVPNSGYAFDRWEGPAASLSDAATTVVLDRETQVTAHFVSTEVPLTVSISPRGAGSVSPGSSMHPRGTLVTLEATPAFGFVFARWEGDADGLGRTAQVVLDGARAVTAVFLPDPALPAGTIACSDTWAAVLKADGTLWAVGRNSNGSQGHELTGDPSIFWPVALCSGVQSAFIDEAGGLALTQHGTLLGWGSSGSGTTAFELGAHPVYTHLPSGIRGCAGMRSQIFFDRYGAAFDGLNRVVEIGFNGEGLGNVTALAEGPDSLFAVTRAGVLYAWGENSCGQLGTADRLPVHHYARVVSGIGGVRRVACGRAAMRAFTLALTDDGRVWSWGDNSFGQLGRPADADHPAWLPAPVPGLSGVVKIVAGDRHGVALDRDGGLYAWGDNSFGQLGRGNYDDCQVPHHVADGIEDVGAGSLYTLVRQSSGLFAWAGQTPGYDEPLPSFTPIAGLTYEAPSIALEVSCEPEDLGSMYPPVGLHYMAVERAIPLNADDAERHEFAYWSGEVDDPYAASTTLSSGESTAVTLHYRYRPDTEARLTLQVGGGGTVSPPAGVLEFEPGTVVTLRADPDSTHRFRCWEGAVTDPHSRTTTVIMDRDRTVSARFSSSTLRPDPQIATGRVNNMGYDGLVLYSDSHVADYGTTAWGSTIRLNGFSDPLDNVVALAVGETHEAALARDGTVWSWGDNTYGQCGSGDPAPASYTFPQKVQSASGTLRGIAAIEAAGHYSLALDADGYLWSWGRNHAGQLGHSPDSEMTTLARAVEDADGAPLGRLCGMACGREFALAMTDEGVVFAWGSNERGQLGGDGVVGGVIPVAVSGLPAIVEVVAGGGCAAALSADGEVWTWGDNEFGQLGHGVSGSSAGPARVDGLPAIRSVAVGPEHMLALDVDGRVWAWGRGDLGQLGNGLPAHTSVPVPVLDPAIDRQLENVRVIACHHVSYAIAADGGLLQWGYDRSLFGDGSDIISRPWRRLDLGRFTTHDPVREVRLSCFPEDGGTLSPYGGLVFVNRGTLLDIQAVAARGYRFVCWEGDISSSLANATIRVTDDLHARARFELAAPVLRLGDATAAPGGTARMGLYLEGDTADVSGVQTVLECPDLMQFGPAHRDADLGTGGDLKYAVPEPQRAILLATAAEGLSILGADSNAPLASVDIRVLPGCTPGDYLITCDASAGQTALAYAAGRRWDAPRIEAGRLSVEPDGGLTLLLTVASLTSGDTTAQELPESLAAVRADRDYLVELWLQDLRVGATAVSGAQIDIQLSMAVEGIQIEGTPAVSAVLGTIDEATGLVQGFGGHLLANVVTPGTWVCIARLRIRPLVDGAAPIDVHRAQASITLDGGGVLWGPAVRVLPQGDLLVAHTANAGPTAVGGPPLSGRWGAQIAGTLTGADPNADDILVYSVIQGPEHGELVSFDAATGTFTYLPVADYAGSDRIVFTVSDGTVVSAPAEQRLFVSRGWCAAVTRGESWCVFGQDEAAGAGFDPVDLEAASGSDLMFAGGRAGPPLQRDLRSVDDAPVWRLLARARPTSTRLAWDSADIPEGMHLIQLGPVADEQVVIDMSQVEELELAAHTDYALDMAMVQNYTVMLEPGWNLLAFPGTPAVNDVGTLFRKPWDAGMGAPVWVLDWGGGSGYQVPERLTAFVGYWFHADGSSIHDLALIPSFSPTVILQRGWNLIGVPFPTLLSDLDQLSGCAWHYSDGRYQPATRMLPGTGYWVYASSAGTMTFVEEDSP